MTVPSLIFLLASLGAAPVGAQAPSTPPPGEYELPSTTLTPRIDFAAEDLEYRRDEEKVRLENGAKVVYSSWTLKAREVDLDLRTNVAQARESVAIEDGRSVVFADSATINLETKEGAMEGVSAGVRPWYIQAESMALEKDRRVFRRAKLTSCNFVPHPHYYISASKLTLYPATSIWIDNAVFYVGRFPVLYMPVFYRDLREGGAVSTSFTFGYDQPNGAEFRTTTVIRTSPAWYSRLYLDYFGLQGLGTGAELDTFRPEGRGAVTGYRIHEKSTGQDRWTVMGGVYQHFASSYTFQTRLQALSDPGFNSQYLRSASFQVTPDLTNNAALTRQTPYTTTRISYARHDSANASGNGFFKDQEDRPRIDFFASPFALGKLPVLNMVSAFADEAFNPSSGTYQATVQGRYEIVKGFSLARGLAVTPRLHYQETYFDKLSTVTAGGAPVDYTDAYVGRYGSDVDLRWSTRAGDTDLAHHFETRLAVNSNAQDSASDDHGIETDLVTLTHALRPNRSLLVRISSGWDMRALRSRSLSADDRLQPVAADAQWTPRGNLSLFASEAYQFGQGSRSFFVQSDYAAPEAVYGLGLSQSDAEGKFFFIHPSLTWRPPNRSWSLAAVVRVQAGSSVTFFDKSFILNKNFHDFATQWVYRARPGNNEFSFHVTLRVSDEQRTQATEVSKEKEFYPWRNDSSGR